MNIQVLKLFICIFCSCIPSLSLAGFDIYTNPQDQSVYYLGLIFGQVSNVLNGSGNAVFGQLFNIFNVIIFSLGSIVLTYTTIVSMINSAQEGEMMGKKWSSLWIPLRSVFGMGILMPLTGGYSLIQAMMMWIVLQGVGAANELWSSILVASSAGVSLNQAAPSDPRIQPLMDDVFVSALCMSYLNHHGTTPPEPVVFNIPAPTPPGGDKNTSTVNAGLSIGTASKQGICGTYTVAVAKNSANPAQDNYKVATQAVTALATAVNSFLPYTDQIVQDNGTQQLQGAAFKAYQVFMDTYKNTLYNIMISEISSTSLTDVAQNAANDGWIFAGSYYYRLIQPIGAPPSLPIPESGGRSPKYETSEKLNGNAKNDFTRWLNDYKGAAAKVNPASSLNKISGPSFSGNGVNRIWDDSFGKLFKKIAISFAENLTKNARDPLQSLQNVGTNIMASIEITFFAGALAIVVVQAIAGMGSWANPAGFVIAAFIAFIMPFATVLMGLLWTAACGIALYLPMIPYILFIFGGISWIIGVIETMVAAPIVALGLTAPSGHEHLGKAEPAVMLVTNIFLRPSLMIIGFVAAAKLFTVAIAMLNFSFGATVNANLSGIGLFGSVALIVLYAGIAITITHKCFSLIHVIPDKVLRWIGGQAEQFGQADQRDEQSVKQTADKGFESSKAVGVASMNAVTNTLKEQAAEKASNMKSQMQGGNMMGTPGTPAPAGAQGAQGAQGVAGAAANPLPAGIPAPGAGGGGGLPLPPVGPNR